MTTRLPTSSVLQRIRAEFLEMPGMRLTCPQAQRLLGLDERACRELLDSLVEARFLVRYEQGTYGRLFEGRAYVPTGARFDRKAC